MAGKKAPSRGVIRHGDSGQARRVQAGALIPDGWTFDDGSDTPEAPAAKKGSKKPKETTQAEGPTETDGGES